MMLQVFSVTKFAIIHGGNLILFLCNPIALRQSILFCNASLFITCEYCNYYECSSFFVTQIITGIYTYFCSYSHQIISSSLSCICLGRSSWPGYI